MNVADTLIRILSAHGANRMAGIPGNTINDVTDATPDQPTGSLPHACHAAMAPAGVAPPIPKQLGDGTW